MTFLSSISAPAPRKLLLYLGLLSVTSVSLAQKAPVEAHPNWPGPGELFVGACYQPIDRSPQEIDNDIAWMKGAGFNVVPHR